LFKLVENNNNLIIKSKATYLATYERENFGFLLDIAIWYHILFEVNSFNKSLQSKYVC